MTARQKRSLLARNVVKKWKTFVTDLKNVEDDIRQLWVEFDSLPKGEKILGCSTQKEFCQKHIGRTPRAVRYMLDGGNHRRGETVSPPPMTDDAEPVTPPGGRDPFKQSFKGAGDEQRSEQHAREIAAREKEQQEDRIRDFARQMIKEGRRALAIKYHPDKGGKSEDMVAVNEAEQRLSRLVETNWADTFRAALFGRGAA